MTEPTPLVRSKAILSESNLYVILSKVNAGPVEELVRPLCSSEMSMQRPRWSRRRFQHRDLRSEEHTSELQSLMRISYAVFCLKKNKVATTSYYHSVLSCDAVITDKCNHDKI